MGFDNVRKEYVDSDKDEEIVVTSNFATGTTVREDTEIVVYVSNGKLKEKEPEPEPEVDGEDEPAEEKEDDNEFGQLLDMAGRPLG